MPLKVWMPFRTYPRILPAVVSTIAFESDATIIAALGVAFDPLPVEHPVSNKAETAVPVARVVAPLNKVRRPNRLLFWSSMLRFSFGSSTGDSEDELSRYL